MKLNSKLSVVTAGAGLIVCFAAGLQAADKFPPLAPLGDPPIPLDNPQTEAKVELGKMLFWDPRLGGDASTACVDRKSVV